MNCTVVSSRCPSHRTTTSIIISSQQNIEDVDKILINLVNKHIDVVNCHVGHLGEPEAGNRLTKKPSSPLILYNIWPINTSQHAKAQPLRYLAYYRMHEVMSPRE